MSVLEAMSWVKPVVTTRVGGIPELIEDESQGLLVDAGDVQALSDALIRLGLDEEERRNIGAGGRRRVEASYSNVAVLPHLERIYQQISDGQTVPGG